MLYREMAGEKVSQLGFGCMRLPIIDGDFSKIVKDEATKMLRYAIDNGVNYVDTAYGYHGGKSEEFVGEALKDGYRDKVNIATKFPPWLLKEYADFEKILDNQLRNLQTDVIDFYLIHALEKSTWDNCVKQGVFKFIEKAKKDGKIRHIGFSFHDEYEVFEEIVNAYDWEFCQIQLNFIDEDFQAGVKGMKLCGEKGIDVIVMEPLRGGSLAVTPPDMVTDIWKSSGKDMSHIEWAFKYIYQYPEVKVCLSGMGSMEMVKQNLEIAENSPVGCLTEDEVKLFGKARETYKALTKVPCTGCRYCIPCPQDIDIPAVFTVLNSAAMFNSYSVIKSDSFKLERVSTAKNCIECRKCESACPQHIEISKEMKAIPQAFGI